MRYGKTKSLATRSLQLAIAAAVCISPAAKAQDLHAAANPESASVQVWADRKSPADRYAEGMALYAAGDEKGAFEAFRSAAARSHGPAQRRLGELYDRKGSVAGRDFAESIRWYQMARAQGENIPQPARRVLGVLGSAH